MGSYTCKMAYWHHPNLFERQTLHNTSNFLGDNLCIALCIFNVHEYIFAYMFLFCAFMFYTSDMSSPLYEVAVTYLTSRTILNRSWVIRVSTSLHKGRKLKENKIPFSLSCCMMIIRCLFSQVGRYHSHMHSYECVFAHMHTDAE